MLLEEHLMALPPIPAVPRAIGPLPFPGLPHHQPIFVRRSRDGRYGNGATYVMLSPASPGGPRTGSAWC